MFQTALYLIRNARLQMDLENVVGWLWPATKHSHSYSLISPHPAGFGLKIIRKARKLIVQDFDSLIGEGRGEENQVKQRKLLTTSHRQTNAQASLQTTATLEAKRKKPSFSTLVFTTEHDVIWYGVALWPVQVGCLGHVPFQSPGYPQPTYCGSRVGKN